jgi:electron transport complex protein RnfE
MATKKVSAMKDFTKGIWEQNATFRQIIGMCPVLAVTVKVESAIGMALATTFVLVFSSLIISIIRNIIPDQVRIAAYVVVIATFVTIIDYVVKALFPVLSLQLGVFMPLIVVNCLILGRAEAFASKNNPWRSTLDAIGMGVGFLVALIILSSIRELLGMGTILGIQIMPSSFVKWNLMTQAPGAFITLGLLIGLFVSLEMKKARKVRDKIVTAQKEKSLSLKNKIEEFRLEAENKKNLSKMNPELNLEGK